MYQRCIHAQVWIRQNKGTKASISSFCVITPDVREHPAHDNDILDLGKSVRKQSDFDIFQILMSHGEETLVCFYCGLLGHKSWYSIKDWADVVY